MEFEDGAGVEGDGFRHRQGSDGGSKGALTHGHLLAAGGDRPACGRCVLGREKPTLFLALVFECTEPQSWKALSRRL